MAEQMGTGQVYAYGSIRDLAIARSHLKRCRTPLPAAVFSTHSVLWGHEKALHALAVTLLTHETLDADMIQLVLNGA
jgi:hypothetical protein